MRQNEVKRPFLTKTRTPSPSGSPKTLKLIKIKVLIGSDRAQTTQNRIKGENFATALRPLFSNTYGNIHDIIILCEKISSHLPRTVIFVKIQNLLFLKIPSLFFGFLAISCFLYSLLNCQNGTCSHKCLHFDQCAVPACLC